MLFDKFINSVAMAKTAFFSKTLKTQARFSPRRVVFATKKKAANLDPNVLEEIQQTCASPNKILYINQLRKGARNQSKN